MNEKRFTLSISACISALLAVSACSKEQAPPPAAEQAPVAAQAAPAAPAATTAAAAAGAALPGGSEANKIFKMRCVVCHGEKGHGDGPGAAALKVKPRNYSDAAWQQSVTDADIEAIIVKGGAAVGKDPGMPGNPDLASKPDVVRGLREIVRSFGPAPAEAPAGSASAAAAPAGSAP
ncbi:MAG TPA: c-type cytochrome [Polyangiaceae bacterium]|nr:c-type cytochrome [Polyangiaceae bacterium]